MGPKHYRAGYWVKQGVFDNLSSFRDLEIRIDAIKDPKDRGDVFEIFVEALLETQPIHQCDDHWVVGDVPLPICEDLNLPNDGTGIDGVYRDRKSNHIPYQVKYRRAEQLAFEEIATFYGVTNPDRDHVLFTNASRLSGRVPKRNGVRFHLADKFRSLGKDQLLEMEAWLKRRPVRHHRASPDPAFQTQALADIKTTLKSHDRATVVMACGTGKTLVSLWAVEQAKAKTVLVVVPTLLLLKQTLEEWSKHTNLQGGFSYLCVCSDKTVGLRNDEAEVETAEAGFRIDTDTAEVRRFLEANGTDLKVVFTTYHSTPVVGEAISGLPPFDIAILDEAHKTTGRAGTSFTYALSDDNVPIKKRLFFTATPRHYNIKKRSKEGDLVFASMDNKAIYGPRAHTLSFAAAIKLGVICPYKVIITLIDKQMIDDFVLKHGITLVEKDLVSARWVANLIAMDRAVAATGARKAITFHSRVATAEEFASDDARGVGRYLPGHEIRHVNGKQRTSDRQGIIQSFRDAPAGILTNARCLTEGIDVPAIDMVAFIDPRHSRVDIAQAVGRAMRKPRDKAGSDKTTGYVVVPLFAGATDDQTLDDAIHSGTFDEVANVINALQEHDEDLVDIISEMRRQKGQGAPINWRGLLEKVGVIGPEINLDKLMESISIEISDRLGNSWDEWFGRLVYYKECTGHCIVPSVFRTEDEYALGSWVSEQRKKRETLDAKRIALLDKLGFVWDALEHAWNEGYESLKAYKSREGNCLVVGTYKDVDGFRLGNWVSKQRKGKEELTSERAVLLEELGFVWEPLEEAWNEGFERLKTYKEREGDCRVSNDFRDDDGFRLGNWVRGQRSPRANLSPGRAALLDELGFVWNTLDEVWSTGYEYLKDYWEREGHCRVSNDFLDDDGFRLGNWVATQRQRKQILAAERVGLLEDLDFIWDAVEEAWNKGYIYLKIFWERTGHCRIPDLFLTDDGYRLSQWCNVQRRGRETLTAERVALLDELGFIWDPRDVAWNEGYERLKAYAQREGHCVVPKKYRDDDGYKLGTWYRGQRMRRETMPPERVALLEEIGFVSDPYQWAWQEGYEYLKAYREREGNVQISSSYRDEDGYKLGQWIGVQRRGRESMSPKRRVLLDELKFIWDPLEHAWNEAYQRLKAFKEREGHCRVTAKYRDENGYRLGSWVTNQRSAKRTMTAERAKLLDELGFIWKVQ
jgi:superfamily II DNA or RNA helicase